MGPQLVVSMSGGDDNSGVVELDVAHYAGDVAAMTSYTYTNLDGLIAAVQPLLLPFTASSSSAPLPNVAAARGGGSSSGKERVPETAHPQRQQGDPLRAEGWGGGIPRDSPPLLGVGQGDLLPPSLRGGDGGGFGFGGGIAGGGAGGGWNTSQLSVVMAFTLVFLGGSLLACTRTHARAGMLMGPGHPAFGGGGMGGGGGGLPPGPGMRWDPIAPQGLPGFHPDDFARGPGRGALGGRGGGGGGGGGVHPDIMQPGPGRGTDWDASSGHMYG
jgi:proteasome inhibitor subunit 1 (PI31)